MLNNTTGHGLSIPSANIDGIYVGNAGAYGMVVNAAVQDGVYVGAAGSPSSSQASTASNGFEVAGAAGSGLYVGRADSYGVYVASAGVTGMTVHNAPTGYLADATASRGFLSMNSGGVGLGVSSSGTFGVYVENAGSDGVEVWSAVGNGVNADGNLYGGYFWGDIYVQGNCVGCLQANFGVNAGERTLQPGDVVSIRAVTATDYDTAPALWQVVPVQPGQAAVGVVAGRAELVIEAEHRPSETGKRLVPRDGAAQPGEYVTVVYSGPMQVKVAPGESAIGAGTRLTAAADGSVRPLQTRTLDGMVVTEGAPVIGVALEASAKDGLVWVLVNPQ